MFSEDDASIKQCPVCRIRTIFNGHDPDYVVKKVGIYDIFTTGEFINICTEKFRNFFTNSGFSGLNFLPFHQSPGFYQLDVIHSLPFDAVKRGVRFIDKCDQCGNYRQVIGAAPAFLKIPKLNSDGIFRSDILFGQFGKKNPLLIFGSELISRVEDYGISRFHYHPVYGIDTELDDAKQVAIAKMKREQGK